MSYNSKLIEIDGHTIEYRICSTGSIDPWSLDYACENKISLMCTSDMAEFILVDGEQIYKINSWGSFSYLEKLKTWGEIEEWLNQNSKKLRYTLSEHIEQLRNRKK